MFADVTKLRSPADLLRKRGSHAEGPRQVEGIVQKEL